MCIQKIISKMILQALSSYCEAILLHTWIVKNLFLIILTGKYLIIYCWYYYVVLFFVNWKTILHWLFPLKSFILTWKSPILPGCNLLMSRYHKSSMIRVKLTCFVKAQATFWPTPGGALNRLVVRSKPRSWKIRG